MKRILFVDHEPEALRGLAELLDPLHSEWEITVVASAELALERLAQEAYDVVVSDTRMPGMSGAALLSHVRRERPDIVRLLAVDPADRELIARTSTEAHGMLARPCSPQALRASLSRGCALQDMLTSDKIRRLVAGLKTLPSVPSVYLDLVEAMKNSTTSVDEMGSIIARDIGMTAKVLQLVNSALFGLPQKITSPGQAATFLGLDMLKSLVLSVQTFAQYDESQMQGLAITDVWEHSMKVAGFARAILAAEKCDRKAQEDGFLAGMMHDCGKLVLALNRPVRFAAASVFAERETEDRTELERRLFGVSHAALGAYVLNSWGLPMSVVEAVAFHHTPSQWMDLDFSPLCAVHVANCMAHTDLESPDEPDVQGLDREYLERLGLDRRLPRWRQACRDAAQSDKN